MRKSINQLAQEKRVEILHANNLYDIPVTISDKFIKDSEDFFTRDDVVFCEVGVSETTTIKKIISKLENNFDKDIINNRVIAINEYTTIRNPIRKELSKTGHNIKIDYSIKDVMKENMNIVFVGNPPYNDGTSANNSIYQNFIKDIAEANVNVLQLTFVIQANWLMICDKKFNDMRYNLLKLGLKKMILNPVDIFKDASVKTVTVHCSKGYKGDITFRDDISNTQRQLTRDEFRTQIVPIGDERVNKILRQLKPVVNAYATVDGKKVSNPELSHIVTSYQNYDIKKNPLGKLVIRKPEDKVSGYRVFKSTTADLVEAEFEYYQSYWYSSLVTFILKYTRFSNTLDNTQIAWVPRIDLNKVYTDDEIFEHFKGEGKLDDTDIEYIKSEINS